MNESSSENGRILDVRLKRARVITVTVLVTFALAVIATVIAFAVDSHLRERVHSDYTDYSCYDYNLTCLELGRPDGKYYTGDDENYVFKYWRIKGESTEDFVFSTVRWRVPLARAEGFVLQNPSTFVYVIKDWTVDEIFVCAEDLSRDEWGTDHLARVVDVAKKNVVASEIREIAAAVQSDELTGNRIYASSRLFVRVTFEESENIVWESELTVCDDGSVAMYGGMSAGDYYEQDAPLLYNPCVLIDEDSTLYSLIGFALEEFKSTEMYRERYQETGE